MCIKGIVLWKMRIPHELLSSVGHKIRHPEECFFLPHTIKVSGV